MPATVAFRVDASLRIGNGHVMRCLTLAAALRERGANSRFICRAHPGHLGDRVLAERFSLDLLPAPTAARDDGSGYAGWLGVSPSVDAQDVLRTLTPAPVDWLVVDHYALDAAWEATLRPVCRRLMVIDDLGNRDHDADLLLDQNLGSTASRYATRVGARCRVLAGPGYSLLRPEFAAARTASLARRRGAAMRHLLVSFGGVDAGNATGLALAALAAASLPADTRITVVLGPHAPALAEVQALAATLSVPVQVKVDVADMAALLVDCDLAIGAAGASAWERCCLGLPTLLVTLAENQRAGAQALAEAGAAILLGAPDQIASRLASGLAAASDPDTLARMQRASAAVTDGLGGTRVVEEMLRV